MDKSGGERAEEELGVDIDESKFKTGSNQNK